MSVQRSWLILPCRAGPTRECGSTYRRVPDSRRLVPRRRWQRARHSPSTRLRLRLRRGMQFRAVLVQAERPASAPGTCRTNRPRHRQMIVGMDVPSHLRTALWHWQRQGWAAGCSAVSTVFAWWGQTPERYCAGDAYCIGESGCGELGNRFPPGGKFFGHRLRRNESR